MPGRLHYTDVATVSISLRTEESLRVEALEKALVAPLKTSTTPRYEEEERTRDKEVLDLVKSERSNATVHLLRQIGPDKCGGPANVISRESSITIFSCSMHFDTMQT